MIPRSDVEIWYSDWPHQSWMPSAERVRDGFLGENREFDGSLVRASLPQAEEALVLEEELLLEAASSDSHDEFEDIMSGYEGDTDLEPLRRLDAGVAGLVLALNAAGAVTATSCRGHGPNAQPGREYPHVALYCSAPLAETLGALAKGTRCGFSAGRRADEDGALALIWAQSVADTLALGRALVQLLEGAPPPLPGEASR